VAADRTRRNDASWKLWTLVGGVGIWVAVTLVSVFAPDMVSGSEQEHLPIAAFTTWFWGLIGTMAFIWAMGRVRRSTDAESTWVGLTIATLIFWGGATIVAIAAPVFVTGSDPTRIPIAAFLAPVAAAVLTGLAGVVAQEFGKG
jgi:hypothetical protein